MPFRSEKQRRFMWSQHPEIAKRWTAEYGGKVVPSTSHAASHRMTPMNALATAAKSAKSKGSKPKLGSGARFAALKSKLSKRAGVTDPGALAAAIGRKKYGAGKMASMANKGR